MITGGYIMIARKLLGSTIANCPPHFREIFFWLLLNANHKDQKVGGKVIRRGQCLCSYKDIMESLSWNIGYRKMTYKKHHCEMALRRLVKENWWMRASALGYETPVLGKSVSFLTGASLLEPTAQQARS